ncbi:DUF6443 domain-containing protein [uncultured Aquimarina sp.]|uniref:DUF6443 domain-containing protein n=1 Tax=uncultured Aquimarina sp. TaxID=575652 RepID=UPI00262BFFC0|nr:DUF6443 domain-containing protein [uncultured Aquimarina sp.]
MKNSIKHSIRILLVLVGMTTTAQVADTVTIEDETINASSDPALLNVKAGQAITIKPTTWIQPGTVFTATISADAYIPSILDTDENYVFTRTFQVPITESQLLNPSTGIKNNSDVIEGITYFDGLGRAKQQIGIKASPDKKDIVTHIGYDEYGRQAKQYLPFERQSGALGSYNAVNITDDINNYYQTKYEDDFIVMAEADVNAYSESIFEPSPLNRVLEQGAPGKAWKANDAVDTDHTIKFDWTTNEADEVVYFKVNFHENNTELPILVKDGFYDPNELYVTITKDENWQPNQTHTDDHTTKEYKDKLGRVILKRTYASADSANSVVHDTYYVYDDFGNLTYVIPPKVDVTDDVSPEELAELCYQYIYDYRNRLVEKKIPGKGWEYIIYNKLDQPILTQDAVQRPQRDWLYTKYDAFGRAVFTGIEKFPWDTTRAGLQNNLDNDNLPEYEYKTNTTSILVNGIRLYYSNNTFPGGGDLLTINYYDNYTFDHNATNPGTSLEQTIDTNVKGVATGSKVRVLGTSYWITTVTYYDQKARPIYVHSTNEYLNTIDIIESKFDFAGKVLETKTTHIKDVNTPIVTIDTFTYDHMGRLLDQKQTINNQAEEQIVANSYDELGQLASKEVGGGLQDVDYTYNVRGWLKEINDVDNIGNDLFSFKINYNQLEGRYDVSTLYNGNISQTIWKTANDNTKRSYAYEYDALNRIKDSYLRFNESLTEAFRRSYDVRDIEYDKNGNIATLIRYDQTGTDNVMDNLTYVYDDGNKLNKVTDSGNKNEGFIDGNNTDNDYLYDDNGNMIKDNNKEISSITYNHLNLPERIEFVSRIPTQQKRIEYVYDATGTKLRKVVTNYPSSNTTEYAGNYIYESNYSIGLPPGPNNSDEKVLKFFNHPEGYIEPINQNNLSQGYQYVYQYKDHLGNIRLSYSDKDNDGHIDVLRNDADVDGDGDLAMEILQEKNYYPFGLQHKGYNNTIVSEHPYGYNGKEEQNELGLDWVDYGARNYDPTLGRWMNPDPVSEFYYDLSPFNYGGNNPLIYTDPNGLWIVNIVTNTDKQGNTSYALSFTAEEGDNLESLSTQLGISEKDILSAHSELGNTAINEGDSFGLGNLEEVKAINGAINEVAGKQDRWNCANFACGSDKTIKSQWDNPNNNNIENLASILKNNYTSVSESSSKIGTIIHYRLNSEPKTKKYLISQIRKNLKAQGKSKVQIDGIINDPKLQKHVDNMSKAVVADERHFSVVVLKNKSGTGVQNIIQKAGQNHFTFKVDDAKKAGDALPYAPTPVGGTNNPYYNKN